MEEHEREKQRAEALKWELANANLNIDDLKTRYISVCDGTDAAEEV